MLLKSFNFSSMGWTLNNLSFGMDNLIVGKNSSGKSKALEALNQVISVISQFKSYDGGFYFSSELILHDVEEGDIHIHLSIDGKKIVKEVLKVNDEIRIDRDEHRAMFEGEEVSPPENMLLMHVRRDIQKYKYIEKIIKWSEETVIRSFIDPNNPSKKELFEHVLKFTPDMRHHLVKMANNVGFPLKDFGTFKDVLLESRDDASKQAAEAIKILLVSEDKVNIFFSLNGLSSGMYRTIVLLILIEQLINLDQPALLAIDDLGEGLDYSRATKVGKLLFDVCNEHGIQLIATSNEEFMMNIVDISKWNILVRDGSIVKSITSDLCPEEFEDFKYSGLSNFDFFTSDFLNRISSKLFQEKK